MWPTGRPNPVSQPPGCRLDATRQNRTGAPLPRRPGVPIEQAMNDQRSCRPEFSSRTAPRPASGDPNRPAGDPVSRGERRPWSGTPRRSAHPRPAEMADWPPETPPPTLPPDQAPAAIPDPGARTADAMLCNVRAGNGRAGNVRAPCTPCRQARRTSAPQRRTPRPCPSCAPAADANLPNAMPHNVRPACARPRPARRIDAPRPPTPGPSSSPRASRGREPPERNAIQRGTAAASSRTRRDRRPRLRQVPLQRGTVARPAARRGSPPRHPTEAARARRTSTHSQCAGQPPHPSPIADDTGNRTLYLTHPRASAPPRRPDH